jgi:hypothetical protein
VHRFALNKIPFDAEKRIELVMSRAQRSVLFFNTKKPRNEKLEMRRERNEQLGFLLGWQCVRLLTREHERIVQPGLQRLELCAKQRIELNESTAFIEIRKAEP